MGRIKELSRKPARTRKRNPVVYLICEGSETEIRYFMIYYIKVYSLPRSQAMRFDSKQQSHCLSCIFSQKIQFAFVDCSSICKQCLCIYKGSNTHGIENLPCVFCLLGYNPNPCEHHGP